jgi:hypothetical protein
MIDVFSERNCVETVPKSSSSTKSREAIPIQGEPRAYRENYHAIHLNKN